MKRYISPEHGIGVDANTVEEANKKVAKKVEEKKQEAKADETQLKPGEKTKRKESVSSPRK